MSQTYVSYLVRSPQPDLVVFEGYAEGGNGADLTIIEGTGVVSITRTDEGIYLATLWRTFPAVVNPGVYGFSADTMTALAGYTAVTDLDGISLAGGTYGDQVTIPFTVFNSSFTGADLLVNQFLTFRWSFRDTTATDE